MDNIRYRYINGKVDLNGVLTLSPHIIANAGENLVTQIKIEITQEVLDTYRFYLEFLLPTQTRFISKPLEVSYEDVESKDKYNQPITRKALFITYIVPRAVALVSGPVIVDVKATNDSVTIWKSKTYTLEVDSSVDPQDDQRYWDGDLLDYLVMHKPDKLKYVDGWVQVIVINPSTGEEEVVNRFPISPMFEDLDTATDWALNDSEATIGQTVVIPAYRNDDPYSPLISRMYIINPDRTLSKVMTQGDMSYRDLNELPILDTTTSGHSLPVSDTEEILGVIKLQKVAKTGKLSDLIGDMNYSVFKMFQVRRSGVIEYNLPTVEGVEVLTLDSVNVNTSIDDSSKFKIEIGIDDNYRTILDQDDIDLSDDDTSYTIGQQYVYNEGDKLRITLDTSSSNISIDVNIRHS